jgi:hypothetical protein
MLYDKVLEQLNDILRRANDNQGTVIISEEDKKAIEESKVAICRLLGYYPDDLSKK